MLKKQHVIDTLMIFIGTFIFAFGLVNFNIANNLAEGGLTGITLILYHLLGIEPSLSILVLNIPLILLGLKFLGKKALLYTFIGTISLSFNLWIWQTFAFPVPLENDLLIAALLAGINSGIGSGIVYRFGGTTGGTDIIARMIEKYTGFTMGKSLLLLDIIVLLLSLSYLSIREMMYTMITVFVFSFVVDFVQSGFGYSSKGVYIISNEASLIAKKIMSQLERGVTFLKSEGAYSEEERLMIYSIVDVAELSELKEICQTIDSSAFISIIDVKEVHGEGFSFDKPAKFRFLSKKKNC
ncbi:YitT family protein [Vagococcus sp.]|uniref:YitT family protein n=1 Tax=Vagococcus sp. TaxID=1933889 RepID=UPI003F9D5FB3